MGHNEVNPKRKVSNSVYIIKWEGVQINNLMIHPKALKNKTKQYPNRVNRKTQTKITAEINEVETNKKHKE